MGRTEAKPITDVHMVAVPYPGRGHVNPMMNLCKLITSRTDYNFLVTFVVTEEWLGFIGSDPKPANIRFATIPNVLPSELVRAADLLSFIEAVQFKMDEPFEQLLRQLESPVNIIVADTFLPWAVEVGNRRNIPVASFWTMPAVVFSVFYHFDLLVQNGHFPVQLAERGEEHVDYIPGISSIRLVDLPTIINATDQRLLHLALRAFSNVSKSQYILFTSILELEPQVINALKPKFSIPIYCLGPVIPNSNLGEDTSSSIYLKWLDSQPSNSVLYVSLGSFLSVSSAQMEEIAAGLDDSGVRYLWVARGNSSRLKEGCGDWGMVVPWCDQLKVLCHSSVGGFWTHCGWNSTKESVFAGVPMLTLPILMDQVTNRKLIVQDWEIGWEVKRQVGRENLLKREDIAKLVKRFMDTENKERTEMMMRVEKFQEICRDAIAGGGSSEKDLNSFIGNIARA